MLLLSHCENNNIEMSQQQFLKLKEMLSFVQLNMWRCLNEKKQYGVLLLFQY